MDATHAQITQMLATHCVICRLPLSDAESTERGYGPICGNHYYNPQFTPTLEMVLTALGLLQASNLPEHIIDGFLHLVNNNHVNARKGCNLLVYWASINYDDREEVFKCSAIIRALGYKELADKLEIDRSVASIEDKGDHLVAFVRYKGSFQRDMDRIPGAKRNGEKKGQKIGWIIPKDKEAHFLIVLGIHYGGQLYCGSRGVRDIPRKRYSDLLLHLQPPRPTTPATGFTPIPNGATNSVTVATVNGFVEVRTPYRDAFRTDLKIRIPWADRTWTGQCWKISLPYLDTVKELIQTHFGISV